MPLPVPYIRDRGGPCYTLSYSSQESTCKQGSQAKQGGGPGGARLAKPIAAHEQDCASITCNHTAALPIVQVELHAPAAEEECTTLVLPPVAEVTRETHAQSHWPQAKLRRSCKLPWSVSAACCSCAMALPMFCSAASAAAKRCWRLRGPSGGGVTEHLREAGRKETARLRLRGSL